MTLIGKMRHRLKLQAPVDTPDGAGGERRTWETVATVWGRLEPLAAEERVVAERLEAVATHRVTIRQREGLTHQMRFAIGNRSFAITGIVGDEDGRFHKCLCEEVLP